MSTGWTVDNLWSQAIAAILPRVQVEYRLSEQESGLILSSFMVGMIIGAGVWGPLSDRIGRKPAFSTTLLLTSLFGTLAAFSPSYPVLCLLLCLMGTGVGGNLPTDGALFLEFIPREHQGLLTLLSLFWPVGSVVSSAVAWALIPPFSCSPPTVGGLCSQEENRGWRYVILTLGGATLLTLIGRSLLFNLKESPKFLLTQGRCQEAMDVLEYLADKNGVQLCLPEKEIWEGLYETEQLQAKSSTQNQRSFSHKLAFLFARPLWLTTTLVWTLWALCSFGYTVFNGFLPKYLESQGGTPVPVDEVYERYVIISAAGIPGSFLGIHAFHQGLRNVLTFLLILLKAGTW